MQTTLAWSLLALATFAETLVYGSATSPCAPQVVEKDRTLEYFILNDESRGRCSNTDSLSDLTECRGDCFSKTAFNAKTRNFTSSCQCCTVKASVQKRITLRCERGSGILEMDYRSPTECICTTCAGASSGSTNLTVPDAV